MSKDFTPGSEGELLIYPAGDGIRVLMTGETVWLTQRQIAELYQVSVPTVNEHLANAYAESDIEPERTIRKFRIVRTEGAREVRRQLDHYNLEATLAVGYRVRSARGTEFRQWATARLSEYLVKGFVLDDERLKGNRSQVDYFDELLARIREIRASEARVYQRIREIFAMAVDYQEGEQATKRFFAIMQNKMHHAATGLTAAEIIRRRADAATPNMGLNTWKGSRVLKQDVGTAKNYLDAQEIDTLNRITVMFLDQAEFRAMRRQDIRLADWNGFLDKFLRDTELPVLDNAGSVSREQALDWAEQQYDTFAERRRLEAEQAAEAKYVEDLRSAAASLEMDDTPKRSKRKKGTE
ncbi:virulence RhuM family protein [Dyella nitratireducens]|uniref:2-hydroxyacid dehydrogenase n=1 Tax=Dyella nitratireducens TaxID=1849580 RepID=A0ABQ1FTQ7_9GAMM|nr:virulence RhuM family protein [Dyella nitratireducens]GGA29752.1 2-hydroxyacid dehydrogenase [Dyella nitratireducens]GLQ43097.1 2-hydroxyacid dehydrogenase [Dyella nitratireducens]